MTSHAFSEKSIAAGFAAQEFAHLAPSDRRKLAILMARIAEQAYRRGAYQGIKLAADETDLLPHDLYSWRYGRSLDQSPWLDDSKIETSTERLYAECEDLEALGFDKSA
ncbi:MAG: hypothetical protein OEU92_24270 [Alphaproteobacteria bacterium]|nr:hypothetical protein [Alphaproteobacteria bacterium]